MIFGEADQGAWIPSLGGVMRGERKDSAPVV